MRKCFADDSKICDCQPTAGRICEGVVALRADVDFLRQSISNISVHIVRLGIPAFGTVTDGVDLLLAAECERCAKAVDHILREGGGTWGDALRLGANV